ncbi:MULTISPECIES: hypothetical protein [unclassified Burkholderia]|uniref:hypothetical protein n=1 Tax=unclassified Burkholderia TaxID=2613784 RepID=UPI00141E4BCB|nr:MULTISPECIES: hypothetical protein [unclassified Burkholderia]NIF68808.1 hypothetical protein [Burkholderia sp. Ap-962]NIF87227.1 hypothetical protein [Burkholderia sp. Cy-637]
MALVTINHIRWRDPISVKFGFTGIDAIEAATLVRSRLTAQFPSLDKPSQCVYVVRLKGDVAIAYGDEFSPVIYIGEGNAATRLYNHAKWIAELLVAVPNAEIEIRVADCVRSNDLNLCQYVEADLISAFINKHHCLPWFNKQREKKYSGRRQYDDAVLTEFNQRIGKVQGSRYLWAIRPTSNNAQYESYNSGWYE